MTQRSYLYPSSSTAPYENDWLRAPWYATTYEKDKQFYNAVGTVEHKTPVMVIAQELTEGKRVTSRYGGFLLVERLDSGERFYIAVTDFVTEAYWECEDIESLASTNPCLAVYHQRSDYYPVDRNGKRYDIADGELVLLCDAQSTNGVSYETNPVEVTGKSGRGFFNIEDLEIIY